jgi:hypothetical protein
VRTGEREVGIAEGRLVLSSEGERRLQARGARISMIIKVKEER